MTPLMAACEDEDGGDVVDVLLEAGADVNARAVRRASGIVALSCLIPSFIPAQRAESTRDCCPVCKCRPCDEARSAWRRCACCVELGLLLQLGK